MREMNPAEAALSQGIARALREDMANQPRTLVSKAHKMGVSDFGTCREKARHMMVKTPFDDGYFDRPVLPAIIGQAIEDRVMSVLGAGDGHLRSVEVEVTLPSGLKVLGHTDWVLINNNAVLDIKTVDGLYWPKREGANVQQLFQRRLYAAGLVQAGILDATRPVLCGNVWFDRSGKEEEPWVEIEEYEPWMLKEVDDWYSDVVYAYDHGEEASKDKPYEWCEKACPFFMSCRGGEEVRGEMIDDPKVDQAAEAYLEGGRLKKEGAYLQDQAKQVLLELNGVTPRHTIKSTWVNESTVPETLRKGYFRLTVREKK